VLLLHVASAVVGFGALVANGINNARAFHSPGPAAATLLRSSQSVARIAYYALYALFVLGIVLITVSDDAFSFAAAWVSASFVVWFVVLGVSHGLVRPSLAGLLGRAEAVGDDPLDGDAEAQSLARRLAIGESLIHLGLVVALVLMIWKPGN
jgi:hypothetical protein